MGKRKGRKRKAAVTLPAVGQPTVKQRLQREIEEDFDLAIELRVLGPCPRRAVEAEVKKGFAGRTRVGAAFRLAARYMPEVALCFWRKRPQLDLRQCDEVVRMLALEHPDFADEVAARQAWHKAHQALVDKDRKLRQQRKGVGMIDVAKDRSGVAVARFGNDRSTPERGQHDGGLTLTIAPNSDRASQPVTVARASDTLGRLLRNQTINKREFNVARRFAADFTIALFDRYPTMKMERLGGSGGDGGEAIVAARGRIFEALKLLGGQGSDQGDLIWRVVGEGQSLRDWVILRRASHPRRLTVPLATGMLTGALQILHPYYFPPTGPAFSTSALERLHEQLPITSGRAGPDAKPIKVRLAEWHAGAKERERVS